MDFKWIICSTFCITGLFFNSIQAQENTTTIDSTTNDYDSNYPDYPNRDYPNLDYYDDVREGRNLENNFGHHDDNENDAQEYPDEFMIKQLRSTIPGVPGVDYALYQSLPDTSFRCESQRSPGFYGDVEAQCQRALQARILLEIVNLQVFHICQDDDRQDSFLCPIGTVFNQISFICDWWFNFRCEDTPTHFHLNQQFHLSSGSASMKDTMNKMLNLRHRKEMNTVMGLKRVNRKYFHNMQQNTGDHGSAKKNMSSKVRNLFMLGLRMDKLRLGRNKETSQQFQEISDITTSTWITETHLNGRGPSKYEDTTEKLAESFLTTTSPTDEIFDGTEVVKASGSTGYVDVSVSEHSTENTSFDNYNTSSFSAEPTMNASDSPSFTTRIFHGSVLDAFHRPLKSLLHLPGLEMIINGSIVTTVKLDQANAPVIETSTTQHGLDMNEELSNTTVERVNNDEDVKEKNELEYQHVTNESIYISSKAETDNSYLQEQIRDNLSNVSYSETTEISEKPTLITTPFNHKNNFIIGNDTHISVSVTIHSNSGRSRLQWKRLPGVKKIRKIRFKNVEVNTDERKNSINETTFKKRNYGEKPMSRVMWIPAKNNVLERRRDWKSVESITYDTVAEIKVNPVEQNLKKSALEMHTIPSIKISDISLRQETNNMSNDYKLFETSSNKPTTGDNLTDGSSDAYKTDDTETEFFTSNDTDIISQRYESQNAYHYDVSSTETVSGDKMDEIIEDTINMQNKNTDEEKNCKTICIKLLRSLHANSSSFSALNSKNSTKFENNPRSLTLFDYENLESKRNPEFNRKSVLGISPSEQWTVKYDPGPDCNENTDEGKILVKGWSVIIDAGSVTKEKTVKRRCKATPDDNRFIMMKNFNSYQDAVKGGINFNSGSSYIPSNPIINSRSMDQSYWLNLVKNWLESSPSSMKYGGRPRKTHDSETSSNNHWGTNKFPDSSNDRHHSILKNGRHNIPKNNFHNDNRKSLVPNKHKRQYPEVRRIRDKKPDWSSDLQMERSDWSQATQRSNDWAKSQNRGPSVDDVRDWDSDTSAEYPQIKDRRQSSRSFDSYPSVDSRNMRKGRDFDARKYWTSRDDSVEDWSSRMEYSNNDWDKSAQDDRNEQSNKRDWSNEFQGGQDKRPSKTDRNSWSSDDKRSSSIPAINSRKGFSGKGVSNPSERSWSKADTRMTDWSSESLENRAQRGPRRGDETSWQQSRKGSDSSDKAWKSNIDPRDEFINKESNKGAKHNRPRIIKDKGRSSTDDWDWSSDKGKSRDMGSRRSDSDRSFRDRDNSSNRQGGKGRGTNINQKSWQDRNFMKPDNADWSSNKKIPQKDEDQIPQRPKGKPNMPIRPRDNRKDWNLDDSKDWKVDSDRRGDPWEGDRKPNNDKTSKGTKDWYSEETHDWNGGEQRKYKPDIKENPKAKQDDSKKDWSSRSSKDQTDWNSGPRKPRNRDHRIDPKPASSRSDSGWKNDPKPEDRFFQDDKSTSSSHSSPGRRNEKGNRDSDFRRSRVPMATQKSWDSKPRNDWMKEEKISTDSFSRDSRRQKGNADDFILPKHGIPQWKSDFLDSQEWSYGNKGDDKSKDPSWDSRDDYSDEFSKDDYDWNSKRKMEDDWSFKPNAQPDRNSFSKGLTKGEMRPIISDGWNTDISSTKSFDGVSWSSNNPSNKDSQKDRMNASGKSWKSSKDLGGRSRNPKIPSSSKGDPQSIPKQSWKNDTTPPKNISNSKGDSEMKKIVWSVQISSDGKTGNGWVPITLRPSLKRKKNGTQDNENNKGSSTKDEDWPSEEMKRKDWPSEEKKIEDWPSEEKKIEDWPSENGKSEDWPPVDKKNEGWSSEETKGEDWSSEELKNADWSSEEKSSDFKENIAQFGETSLANNFEVGTEVNPSTSNLPEASFSHLFYIPTSNTRYKRDRGSDRSQRLRPSSSSINSYKVVKSGEILNDALRESNDSNRFFLAKADIIVEGNDFPHKRDNLIHFTLKKLLDQETNDSSFHNFKPSRNFSALYNHGRKTRNDAIKFSENWDKMAKESVIKGSWSPFYSSNFSSSGWIPVNTHMSRNFSERNSSIFQPYKISNKSDNRTHIVNKHTNLDDILFDYGSLKNMSQNLLLNTTATDNNFSQEDKTFENSSNDSTISEEANETKIKVGNKTLRILSFSDIMKQFNGDNKPHLQVSSETWNTPITSAPKMYSLKLVDPSIERKENLSNSWSFPAVNGTKQAWILIEKSNSTSNSTKEFSTNEVQMKPIPNDVTEYKIIVGNRTVLPDTNKLPLNSSSTDNKGFHYSKKILKLSNLQEESDWRPVVTGIGRVVPFNRTITKGS